MPGLQKKGKAGATKVRLPVINTKPEIKTVSLTDLKPAPYNPRVIDQQEMSGLRASLRKFGLVEPIVWNKRTGFVVGGHQRLKAMQEEGIKEANVVVVDLSEQDEKALNVTLNNPNIQGSFVNEALSQLLEGIRTDVPEFEEIRLDDLLGEIKLDTETVEDDTVPALPTKARAKLGDVWKLGEHRIFCGDSTKAESWKKLMAGAKAAMVFTDPPYGVSYESSSGKFDVIEGDDKRDDDLVNSLLSPALKMASQNSNDNAGFYIWHDPSTRNDFVHAMKMAGLIELGYIIWAKPSGGMGANDYRKSHEPCFYASKQGQKPAFYGDRTNISVWRASYSRKGEIGAVIGTGVMILDGKGGAILVSAKAPKNKKVRKLRIEEKEVVRLQDDTNTNTVWEVSRETDYEHPTQKPVSLATKAIINSSRPGDIVIDPFLGSGCTLMGAEQTKRICYAMELDPRYVDVEVKRWEQLTGEKATLGKA